MPCFFIREKACIYGKKQGIKKKSEKISKNLKKGIDKYGIVWYTMQALSERDTEKPQAVRNGP